MLPRALTVVVAGTVRGSRTVTLAEPGSPATTPSLTRAVHSHTSPALVSAAGAVSDEMPASVPSWVQDHSTLSSWPSSGSRLSRSVTRQRRGASVRPGSGLISTVGADGAVLPTVMVAMPGSPKSRPS